MGTDRLIGAVIAAQRGHEFEYNVLIKHLKAAIFDVHSRKISVRMKQDDWYSEGLEILMKCVQKYDCNRPRAKFSTYFITWKTWFFNTILSSLTISEKHFLIIVIYRSIL